jgi:hypothetical protein
VEAGVDFSKTPGEESTGQEQRCQDVRKISAIERPSIDNLLCLWSRLTTSFTRPVSRGLPSGVVASGG